MIRYFRNKKRKRKSSLPDTIHVSFENRRNATVLVRNEDDSFDYIRTITVPPGAARSDFIPKGTTICVWQGNQIVGEYTIKPDRDDDIDIIIE